MTIRQSGSTSGWSQFDAASDGSGVITSQSPSATPLVVRGASGQSGPLIEAQNSAGTPVFGVSSGGTTLTFGANCSNDPVELSVGAGRTANGFAYIDLVGDTTYSDYGLRIIRNNSGANTQSNIVHRGTGALQIQTLESAPIFFATSSSDRMIIDSNGDVGINVGNPVTGIRTFIGDARSSSQVVRADNSNGSYNSAMCVLNAWRSNNSAYIFLQTLSGNYADTEHYLRGDGQAFSDGAWNSGGADYAEYFEWHDGNPDNEDRRGISVTLLNDKIVPAQEGDAVIGVISGNPSVVGDAAWNKWAEKYLRDDFGSYIMEDYEVLQWIDADGNERAVDADGPDAGEAPQDAVVVIQQRRKLNPAFDPDQEYISREQRPEWDCVGLMGKLRLRKGQPVDPRWIKMRDISDTVEEWLVR